MAFSNLMKNHSEECRSGVAEPLPWQLKLFAKSIKKKEKLKLLRSLMPDMRDQRVLDLGCARGTLSYFLRRFGGGWVHADLDLANVDEAQLLLGSDVVQVGEIALPFASGAFDSVVTLDYIEHLTDDRSCVRELARVLRPGGRLILSTPITGRWFVLNRLKNRLGMTPDVYGHKREGYTLQELADRLNREGFMIEQQATYSRFFTEFVELLLNVLFTKVLGRRKRQLAARRDGHISPGSAQELSSHRKAFLAYSLIYPVTFAISQLDRLIPFIKGYATLFVARKQA